MIKQYFINICLVVRFGYKCADIHFQSCNKYSDAPGPEVYDSVLVSGLPASIDSTFGLSGVCFNIIHTYDQDWYYGWFLQMAVQSSLQTELVVLVITSQEPVCRKWGQWILNGGSPPYTGTWIPPESLNQFNNGQNPNGWWYFAVHDVAECRHRIDKQFLHLFYSNPPWLTYPAIHSKSREFMPTLQELHGFIIISRFPVTARILIMILPMLTIIGGSTIRNFIYWVLIQHSGNGTGRLYMQALKLFTLFHLQNYKRSTGAQALQVSFKAVISCIDTADFASMDWSAEELYYVH